MAVLMNKRKPHGVGSISLYHQILKSDLHGGSKKSVPFESFDDQYKRFTFYRAVDEAFIGEEESSDTVHEELMEYSSLHLP